MNILIIMLIGLVDEVDRVMGLEFGVDDYLMKFFLFCELLVCVRVLLCCVWVFDLVGIGLVCVWVFCFLGWEFNI